MDGQAKRSVRWFAFFDPIFINYCFSYVYFSPSGLVLSVMQNQLISIASAFHAKQPFM